MQRVLWDVEPGTVVLATGDGAGGRSGRGFLRYLQNFRSAGWAVETIAWNYSCNHALRQWVEEHGRYIALEGYYESITYVPGIRAASPLSLRRRFKKAVRVEEVSSYPSVSRSVVTR
jgi:hypothetical protein